MTEEQKVSQSRLDAEHSVDRVISRLVDTAKVDAVFGQPVERGNATVIPCAEVSVGLGFGFGGGPIDERGNQLGGGAGAGGNSTGRPIAAIIVTQDDVRVEPIMDLTKISLAGMTTATFMLLWLLRLIRGTKSDKGPSFSQLNRARKQSL